MLKSYVKTAIRTLLKSRIFSTINIFGLAIGMASTLLIAHYVKFERSYERHYANAENIYRITLDLYNDGEFVVNDCETYQTLGPEFKAEMPEVLDFARFFHLGTSEIYVPASDTRNYEHLIYFADASAFTLFDYNIKFGDPAAAFDKPHKVLVNESIANKYFGRSDIIGERIEIGSRDTPFEVVGVMEDLPQNTHLKFDILISHNTIPKIWSWYEKYPWGGNNEYTYLLMDPNANLKAFNTKLEEYSLGNDKMEDEIIIAEKITTIHLYSNKTFEPEVNGSAQTVNFMVIIAIFILLLAWVNYVNLSTSKALERAKEVGVRKVVGSSKGQLVGQFIFDSFLVNFLAAVLAFTLVQMSIPYFKNLTGQDLPSSILAEPQLMLLLTLMILLGTLVSGLYPAIVLSSFKPVSVLKGKFTNSAKGLLLRKGLVTFQFLTTVVLLSVSLAVYFQVQYLSDTDLGINIDNTLVLRSPPGNQSDSIYSSLANTFQNKMAQSSLVSGVTNTDGIPGSELHDISTSTGIKRVEADEKEGAYNYYHYGVKENFFGVMEVEFVAGKGIVDGVENRVVINEKAVQTLGFDSPEGAIGKKITFNMADKPSEVVGVFRNFFQRSPKEVHIPMIIYAGGGDLFVIKSNSGRPKELLSEVEATWKEVFPNNALDYYFLDDRYNFQYETDQRFGNVTILFTILSVLIAVLGLFGLSTFTILQRKKEIGIRKVLGSSLVGLIRLLSQDFIRLVLLAGILDVPIGLYIVNLWLDNYASQIEIEWWLFAIPIALILLIAFSTVIGQTLKTATENPVNSLRQE